MTNRFTMCRDRAAHQSIISGAFLCALSAALLRREYCWVLRYDGMAWKCSSIRKTIQSLSCQEIGGSCCAPSSNILHLQCISMLMSLCYRWQLLCAIKPHPSGVCVLVCVGGSVDRALKREHAGCTLPSFLRGATPCRTPPPPRKNKYMYVCIYMYYIYTYIHVYMYISLCMCTCTCIWL